MLMNLEDKYRLKAQIALKLKNLFLAHCNGPALIRALGNNIIAVLLDIIIRIVAFLMDGIDDDVFNTVLGNRFLDHLTTVFTMRLTNIVNNSDDEASQFKINLDTELVLEPNTTHTVCAYLLATPDLLASSVPDLLQQIIITNSGLVIDVSPSTMFPNIGLGTPITLPGIHSAFSATAFRRERINFEHINNRNFFKEDRVR